jgi:glycosyltransferase involved in cell wall biosynthesis
MKFSIVVPVYNVEDYLEQCLESLQAQDFQDFEAVCINDGSTDNSRRILAEWEERFPQMKVIDRENGGLSAARNTGLKASTGEYVVFVDSDDWVESTMLSRLVDEIHGEDMVCFACRRTDNEKFDVMETEQGNGWDYFNRHALEHREVAFVCVWQRCYCRQFLLDNDLWFREGILHEDNQFTPRVCLKAQNIKVIPDVLYNYRIRPGSIMTTRGLRSKESLVLIANELSSLFEKESDIEKTVIYQALTQCYQMSFLDNSREDNAHLQQMVDWKLYRKVSRTKLRHRWNYFKNRFKK